MTLTRSLSGLLTASVLATGLAVPASALTSAELNRFLEVAADVGCVITAETAAQLEQQTGFSAATLQEIMVYLFQNNGAVAESLDLVRVTLGPCAR